MFKGICDIFKGNRWTSVKTKKKYGKKVLSLLRY